MSGSLTLDRQSRDYAATKRVADLALATLLLAILLPVCVLIAVAIALDAPGAVLYRQRRIGYQGQSFTMLKFRTMLADPRVRCAPIVKVQNDPRITRVGRVLRRTSLDELPQLVNVLRGDMSLVGPRPELPELVAEYGPSHHLRHVMLPGLTGWWQIHGRRLRPDGCPVHDDLDTKLADDLYYFEHRSLGFDLKILLLTLPVVLYGRGGG